MARDFHEIKPRIFGLLMLGIASMPLAAAAGPLSSGQRKQIAKALESYKPRASAIADTLWANPELGFLETKASGLSGELRVYGSPAEEGGSGKVYMVREGGLRRGRRRLVLAPV